MKRQPAIKLLFVIAALYDGILGLLFLLAGTAPFQWVNVTPPNHLGYVQFPAALLIIFALMFAAIARRPSRNRHLIPYGMLLKVSYCAVVFGHWFSTGVPWIWKPFAILDLVFLVFFVWAYMALRESPGKETGAQEEVQPVS